MNSADPGGQRIYKDLRLAIDRMSNQDLAAWGSRSAARLPKIMVRRVKNLGSLIARIGKFTANELSATFASWKRGELGEHFSNQTAGAIDKSIEVSKKVATAVGTVGNALVTSPKKTIPDLMALALGFYAGSGGSDADGGIPDTDLALGVGWHRSVFTHSIMAGVVFEGAILSIADLADVVCNKIPSNDRDPFWDKLAATKDSIALKLAAGASAGIAYHLSVDATIQEAPYKDWPFSMPIEMHQAVIGANAAAEGLDALHKGETTGEKVVRGVKKASNKLLGIAGGIVDGIKGGNKSRG